MNVIWKVPEHGYVSLEEINTAISKFIETYEITPDAVCIHHTQLNCLTSNTYHLGNSSEPFLKYEGTLKIQVKTYIGYMDIEVMLKNNEKYLGNTMEEYFTIKNREAEKVDKILLGDE